MTTGNATQAMLKSPLRFAAALCLIAACTGAAAAQGVPAEEIPKSNSWSTQTLTMAPKTLDIDIEGLKTFNAISAKPDLAAGADISDSMFDLTGGDKVALFNTDDSGQLCLLTTDECALNDESFGLGIQGDFAKSSPRGLGLALQPRAGVSFDDDSSSALVGALVKIGDNLQNAENINPNTWYFFAGADAQAMTYTPGRERLDGTGRFALRDSVIVGGRCRGSVVDLASIEAKKGLISM